MIDIRKQSDFLVSLNMAGTQSTGTSKDCRVVPFACELIGILARVGTAGTTGSQICDLMKNGTTIFSQAAKITFASAATTPTAFSGETAVTSPVKFAAGDIIRVDITQVHTTPAVDLDIALLFRRTGAGGVKKVSQAQVASFGSF